MKKQTYIYDVSIRENDERTTLDFDKTLFSDVAPYYGGNNVKIFYRSPLYDFSTSEESTINGVFENTSLNGLVYVINNFSTKYYGKELKKDESLAILKLLLKGGTSSKHAYKSAHVLFYDIDVKNEVDDNGVLKQENLHLFNDMELNNKVFDFMESISIITFRSKSKKGMAGILYVPILGEDFIINNKHEHIKIGKEINDFINRKMNAPCDIEFDQAQNKFRQLRYIPAQKSRLKINPNYVEFHVERTEIEVEKQPVLRTPHSNTNANSRNNAKKEGGKTSNSIIDNYNEETLCTELLEGYFSLISQCTDNSRYNRNGGDSKALVVYHKTNTFCDWSTKIKGSLPFDLLAYLRFNGDKKEAYKFISKKYNEKLREKSEPPNLVEQLSSPWYSALIHLGYLNEDDVKKMIEDLVESLEEELNPFDKELKVIKQITDFGFRYPYERLLNNKSITVTKTIKDYLDPDWLLENMDKYINVIISGCGTGKTSAFLNLKNAIAKRMKVLFISPRTIMVHQQAKGFKQDYNIIASASGECDTKNDNVEFTNTISNNLDKLFDSDISNMIEEGVNLGHVIDYRKSELKKFKPALKSGIMTYDQFRSIDNQILDTYDYICIDESHILSSDTGYRADVIEETLSKISSLKVIESTTKFVLLTATPGVETNVLYEFYKDDFKILNAKKTHDYYPCITAVNINKYNKQKIIFNRILESVEEGRKVIVLINSKNKIRSFWRELQNYCDKKGLESPNRESITSDNKESIAYQRISSEESLGDIELLLTTSLLEVGVNIDMDCGIDFIFDYTDNVCYTDAKNALQLIYRNRNLSSRVYCYAKMFDGNSLITESLGSEKILKPLEEILSSKCYKNHIRKIQDESIIKIKELKVESIKERDLLAETTEQITKDYGEFEKQLAAFLILGERNGCNILFDFFQDEEKNESTPSKTNDFVLNTIKSFLDLKTDKNIKVSAVVGDSFTSKEIHENFEIISTNETKENDLIVEAKYHTVYHHIAKALAFQFSYIKNFYRDDIKNVFNYIFDEYPGKGFDAKIKKYFQTHKCLSKKQRMVASFIEEEFETNAEYDRTSIEMMHYEIKDKLGQTVKNSIKEEVYRHQNKKLVKKVDAYFDEVFNKYLLSEIDKTFYKMYHIKKQKGAVELKKLYVLDFDSKYDSHVSDSIELDMIKAFMAVDNELLLKPLDDNLNNCLLNESINNYSDNILLSRRLKKKSDKSYSSDDGTTWKPQRDYFSSNTSNKASISVPCIWEKYSQDLNQFKALKENKRAKQCFVSINLGSDEIVIAKTKKRLFEMLESDGSLGLMFSSNPKDFRKRNIFNKYFKDVLNYHITDLKLTE